MLKKLVISILIVLLVVFTIFGQPISLEDRGISQGTNENTVERMAVNTPLVEQLTTQTDPASVASPRNGNLDAQEVDTQWLIDAGRALKNFRNNYYLGWGMQVAGTILVVIGVLNYPHPGSELWILLGYITTSVGAVWQFFAFNSIGVAGERLIRAGGGH